MISEISHYKTLDLWCMASIYWVINNLISTALTRMPYIATSEQGITSLTKGCHTHSFCTTICNRGRNECQRSNRNICHSQWSSHYISDIFNKIRSREMSQLKPGLEYNFSVKIGQGILTAVADRSTGITTVTPLVRCLLY